MTWKKSGCFTLGATNTLGLGSMSVASGDVGLPQALLCVTSRTSLMSPPRP
jgi:hypothetical protein